MEEIEFEIETVEELEEHFKDLFEQIDKIRQREEAGQDDEEAYDRAMKGL